MKTQGFIVWGAGIVVILGIFLCFVFLGWPGDPNGCTTPTEDAANTCFCEDYKLSEVESGIGGVRQPVNTWFNLYSIGTSLVVACFVYCDRKKRVDVNPMRSHCWIPDLYIFAVLFLGLGSMWLHASLKDWGGVLDQLSMFFFAAFLVFYSIYRLWPNDWFFALGHLGTVALFTFIAWIWDWEYNSLILIMFLVGVYLLFELLIIPLASNSKFLQGKTLTVTLWLSAVVAILSATVFWALSQTGEPLCDPESWFQPHGLLWHPLAGAMAVLLYFYWRDENVR